MKVEFPARARCIEGSSFFRKGEEVRVLRTLGIGLCVVESEGRELIAYSKRFKPVIRVRT